MKLIITSNELEGERIEAKLEKEGTYHLHRDIELRSEIDGQWRGYSYVVLAAENKNTPIQVRKTDTRGGRTLRTIETVVGRPIVLAKDNTISRKHLKIILSDLGAVLDDEGSLNGTVLDGMKFSDDRMGLHQEGQHKLQMGRSEFTVDYTNW